MFRGIEHVIIRLCQDNCKECLLKRYWGSIVLMATLALTGCGAPDQAQTRSLEERLVNHNAALAARLSERALQGRPSIYSATTGQIRRMVLASQAVFLPGSSRYRPGYLGVLQPMIRELKARRDHWKRIDVVAFADRQDVAERQAEKIAAYCWFNGVPQTQLTYHGVEAAKAPVSRPDSITGRMDNRRIEVTLN